MCQGLSLTLNQGHSQVTLSNTILVGIPRLVGLRIISAESLAIGVTDFVAFDSRDDLLVSVSDNVHFVLSWY